LHIHEKKSPLDTSQIEALEKTCSRWRFFVYEIAVENHIYLIILKTNIQPTKEGHQLTYILFFLTENAV
jgi:hypothetical protein